MTSWVSLGETLLDGRDIDVIAFSITPLGDNNEIFAIMPRAVVCNS